MPPLPGRAFVEVSSSVLDQKMNILELFETDLSIGLYTEFMIFISAR